MATYVQIDPTQALDPFKLHTTLNYQVVQPLTVRIDPGQHVRCNFFNFFFFF
jgi:hypothetical protein